MKRILLESHNYSLTGAPLVLLQLAKGLKGEYETIMWSPFSGPLELELEQADLKWYALGSPESLGEYMKHPWAKPDLVIANTLLSWPVVLEARSKGIPCLWWLHEGARARQALMSQGLQEALALHSEYVVSSRYLAELYKGQGYVHEIPYGVPVTPAKEWGNPGDRPLEFLVAGTIEWRKGQDRVLEAWSRVKPQGARLTLLGDASNGWAKSLRGEYSHLSGVTWLDPMSPSKFSESLGNYDILLVPSRDEGGYPQVLLQAQEKGLCVVAWDCCGMKEQVRPGTGYIKNSIESLGEMISNITPEQASQVGKQARRWAHFNNSLETHIQDWKSLIEEVI